MSRPIIGACAKAVGLALAALCALPAQAQSWIRTDDIAYEDNFTYWVVNQQKSSTNVETGLIESRTVYNTQALPDTTYAFEKLQQRFTYYADGNLATASDGRDTPTFDTTVTFANWKRGIPRLMTFADLTTKSAVVDDYGLIRSVTDETNATTCYSFDDMGRLKTITYPSEATGACGTDSYKITESAFEQEKMGGEYGIAAGHWRQTIRTDKGVKRIFFDALWRPVVEETYDELDKLDTWSQTVTRYDVSGNVAFKSYPLGGSLTLYTTPTKGVRTFYDKLDRPTRVEQDSELGVLATTTTYGDLSTTVTNPRGKPTTTFFQAYDQPTFDWPVGIVHPENADTTIARDLFGKPTSITRSGGTPSVTAKRRYFYNANQELCRREEPETGATFMGYDAGGNVAWSASGYDPTLTINCVAQTAVGGRRVDRTYDNRNRLSTLTFVDHKGDQAWSYEADGRPASITTLSDGVSVVNTYTYNKRRLLTGEQLNHAGYLLTQGYAYNANGHLAAHVQPDGETLSYAPNALGQATQATSGYANYATNVSYYPNGALAGFTYGNGIQHTLTQNARFLPDRSKDQYTGSMAVLDDSYVYDANGNVAAIVDGLPGAPTSRTMTYDDLDRLKKVVSPLYGAVGANYTYDALDNLKHITIISGGVYRDHLYCYDAAWHLTNLKTTSCSTGASVVGLGYDVQGNVINKNGQGYVFDIGNRLRAATGKETYQYDANGRRVLATLTADAKNLVSMYGQDGVLRYQRDERTTRDLNYVYLAGSLVAVRDSLYAPTLMHRFRYQHTDALGTPVAVTDESRNVVERNTYEPYGARIGGVVANGVGYTGHVMDKETGLTYMQQRYYDPQVGQLLSVDPVAADDKAAGSFNRYWYASNNPYKFTDPDGREVRLQWHEVEVLGIGTGEYHMLLTITPVNQVPYKGLVAFNNKNSFGMMYSTLGAGNDANFKQDLAANVNRPNDRQPHSGGIVIPTPASYKSEDAFISALFKGVENFQKNTSTDQGAINYGFWPESQKDEYNSNSFIAGLLQSAGAELPQLRNPPPGAKTPVPVEVFREKPKK